MESSDVFKLLTIKIEAAGCSTILQRVEQMMEEWDSARSEEFVTKRIQIGVELPLAKDAFASVVAMAEQLIRSPPPYDQNPDEQRYRRIELLVLCGRAHTLSENLLDIVKQLKTLIQQSSAYSLAQGLVMLQVVKQEAEGNIQNASKLASLTITAGLSV